MNDYTEANHKLIVQVAGYYNGSIRDAEFYQDIEMPSLVALSHESMIYWKKELHKLIFNGLNCTEESIV